MVLVVVAAAVACRTTWGHPQEPKIENQMTDCDRRGGQTALDIPVLSQHTQWLFGEKEGDERVFPRQDQRSLEERRRRRWEESLKCGCEYERAVARAVRRPSLANLSRAAS